MFPLHTKDFPTSAVALEQLLNKSIGRLLITRSDAVRVVDQNYPALKEIAITLDGAELRTDAPRPPLKIGAAAEALQVERFQLGAEGILLGPAVANLALTATDVHFAQGRNADDEIVLELEGAARGTVEVSIRKTDLERAIAEMARREAGKHGVAIDDVRLILRQVGTRAVDCEASFRARKLFFSTKVRMTANLAIDDELNARISNLRCTGEGAIGSLACGFLGPHLEKADGRTFALMSFALGQVRLHDIRLGVADNLTATADFGS